LPKIISRWALQGAAYFQQTIIGIPAQRPRPKKSSRIVALNIDLYVKIRSILLAFVLAIGCSALFAPAPLPAQTGQAAQKLDQLAAQLSLTPQQKRQLIPVLAAEAPKLRAIKADTSLSKMQKIQQLKAVHDETDPQVRAILSPDQYQKLQQIRRQEVEQMIGNRSGQ
jgi:hypothetical protein